MPRDNLRLLLAEHSRAERVDITGQIMSKVTLMPYDSAGELMPTAHVAVNTAAGVVIVSHVPVAANNKILMHAALGSPVLLRRSRTGRLEIIGLDKRCPGTVHTYVLNIATGSLTSGAMTGFAPRPLTYSELMSYTPTGYGETPFGANGVFGPSSNFLMFA